MNGPNLVLQINILHHLIPRLVALLQGRPIIPTSRLLPSRSFFFGDRLPRHAVEEVAALTGEPLEVVGYVLGGKICCCEAAISFGFLLFPAGIEEFN